MGKEILLIDDDTDELEVFTDALQLIDKNYQCFQAKTPEEALDFLQTRNPGFLFIDFNMPRINGLECVVLLRDAGKLRNSKAILYSNYITEAMREQAIELGAYNCIQKPNTIIELSEKLMTLLNTGLF